MLCLACVFPSLQQTRRLRDLTCHHEEKFRSVHFSDRLISRCLAAGYYCGKGDAPGDYSRRERGYWSPLVGVGALLSSWRWWSNFTCRTSG